MQTNKNEAGNSLPQAFTFNASDQQVRTFTINSESYFVAADICSCLAISNNRDAVSRLDDDEKRVSVVPTPGGPQSMTLVNESGLYNLIFQSRKPEAKEFRKWVTSEVLPALRRTGEYRMAEKRPVRTGRTRGELVNADILNLLWLIGESLERGDQQAVAMELGVSRQTVNRTLNGYCRSSRVLMALYRRAQQNRERFLLYHQPSVMADRLLSGETVPPGNHLPSVWFEGRRRGAAVGNQNARKDRNRGGR